MLSTDVRDEALRDRVGALGEVELRHEVGAVFEYTDANYDVLGLLVQTVSGQSFESYIAENVFEPLDMRHSYTDQSDARLDGLATGHRSWFGYPRPFEAPYSRAAMPSSYLISSAEDVTHFLIMQLNGGRYAATSVVSPEGVAAMHTARDQARRPGHLLRHGVGVPVAERGAGGAPRRHQRQLLRRHAPRPAGPMGRRDSDQLRLAQPQRRPAAGSEPWSAQPPPRHAAGGRADAPPPAARRRHAPRGDRHPRDDGRHPPHDPAAAPLASGPGQPAPRRPSHGAHGWGCRWSPTWDGDCSCSSPSLRSPIR